MTWVALIPVLVQAGVAIYEAIGSAARGEDPGPAIERARAAIASIPIRSGVGGAWEVDTASRLRGRVAVPVGLAPTEPPPSPFEGVEDIEAGALRVGLRAMAVELEEARAEIAALRRGSGALPPELVRTEEPSE